MLGWSDLPPGPLVMGVLNVTPDSFSDGGDHHDPAAAIAAGHRMAEDGAHIIDIGGETTRPGAEPTPPAEEQRRILPVIAALRHVLPISVDTRNASTMAAALDAGAAIVNDVSGLTHDPAAPALIAARRCPVILMHMRGTPATMNALAVYGDVAEEVAAELGQRVRAAEAAGIRREQIALDPGIGFAKIGDQNLRLLRGLARLAALGLPIVAGVSRKRFIGHLTGREAPKERDAGSLAAGLFAISRGARILRVHDVRATADALRVWHALGG